jgi:hypothetical protein
MATMFGDPVVAVKSITAGTSGIPVTPTRRRYLYVLGAGTNDDCIGPYPTVAAYADAVAAHLTVRKSIGFEITAITSVIPRATGSEVNRAAYNALVRDSSWRSARGINYLIDLAAEPIMGVFANTANLTYYQDGTHPTILGAGLLAAQATSVMNTILGAI